MKGPLGPTRGPLGPARAHSGHWQAARAPLRAGKNITPTAPAHCTKRRWSGDKEIVRSTPRPYDQPQTLRPAHALPLHPLRYLQQFLAAASANRLQINTKGTTQCVLSLHKRGAKVHPGHKPQCRLANTFKRNRATGICIGSHNYHDYIVYAYIS